MTYTDFGRAIYAIGGNATAARLAGINLSRVRVLMYMFSGAIAGLAGVLLTSRTTSGNPVNGTGLELQAITAVFLGGAATAGGKGTIVGTFLAVILVGVLNNGMNLLGFNTFIQRVALGLLLIAAVAISQWRQARAERPHQHRRQGSLARSPRTGLDPVGEPRLNVKPEVDTTTWHGIAALVLENETFRTVVVPTMGAKIVSLLDKRTGVEWLAGPGDRPFRPASYGATFDQQDMSGWDEMFPTITACPYPAPGAHTGVSLPDHGEVWAVPWTSYAAAKT